MEALLDEVCGYLKNWFVIKPDGVHRGTFTIENGTLQVDFLAEDQYFRIKGSVFNDGIYKHPDGNLIDEEFSGEIWAMGVPPALIALMEEITAWNAQYGGAGSVNMSPLSSESFNNYSYSKRSAGGNDGGAGKNMTWQDAYASRLSRWRKL